MRSLICHAEILPSASQVLVTAYAATTNGTPASGHSKVAGETNPTQVDICISALSASVTMPGLEGTLIGGHRPPIVIRQLVSYYLLK